ncbi:MAG: zinc-binding dehydrogenase [Actinomycetota bacterium]
MSGRLRRAAVLDGPRSLSIRHDVDLDLRPGTVLVAVDRCGIGGSDVAAWISGEAVSGAWFGHEWVGRVLAAGEAAEHRYEGERVVGATSAPCGRCRPCRAGIPAHCTLVLAMILGTDEHASPHGAFADVIRVDARRVQPAPEGVDDTGAALAEPAAVAMHAVTQAEPQPGDLVAVIGAGTIGLATTALARLAGAGPVVAVDPEPAQRDLACDLGADAAVAPGPELRRWLNEHGHGLGADVVYDCAGRADSLAVAADAARPGGRLVVVGAMADGANLDPSEVVVKQLTVRGSLAYTVSDVRRALELMADDRLRLDGIVDREVGFADLATVLTELANNPGAPRKVMFAPAVGS